MMQVKYSQTDKHDTFIIAYPAKVGNGEMIKTRILF